MKNNEEKNKVIRRIEELCKKNDITVYRLSINSAIPYTTLNNMIRNDTLPTIPTIEKICKGFNITMAQFFQSEEIYDSLTLEQKELLEIWDTLNSNQKNRAKDYLKGLSDQ